VKKIITLCLLALIPAMLSFPVLAQDFEARERDRFKINVGAFFVTNTDTTIRAAWSSGLSDLQPLITNAAFGRKQTFDGFGQT
jgi:hypothetical protein